MDLYYTCYLLAIGKARQSVSYINPLEAFAWCCVAFYWLVKMVNL